MTTVLFCRVMGSKEEAPRVVFLELKERKIQTNSGRPQAVPAHIQAVVCASTLSKCPPNETCNFLDVRNVWWFYNVKSLSHFSFAKSNFTLCWWDFLASVRRVHWIQKWQDLFRNAFPLSLSHCIVCYRMITVGEFNSVSVRI